MQDPFEIGGTRVAAGTSQRIELPVARLFTQEMLHLPLTVVHGREAGPRVWLSAAIHGDEINGTEIVRQVLEAVGGALDRGTLVAAPIVNLLGFLHQSRYLPDRRDLNRCFPGSSAGSLASQLAHLFMKEVVERCTHGIDLHTGSHHRTNLPQIRGDLANEEVLRLARTFGPPLIVHAKSRSGSLRGEAARRGIPVLLYEASEPLRFDRDATDVGVRGILRVLDAFAMKRLDVTPTEPPIESHKTHWVRANRSGVLHLDVELGTRVRRRQIIGVIRDAFGDPESSIRPRSSGLVVGHTMNPLVSRGDAVVHVAEYERSVESD